jgi:hypothetical protein
MGLILKKLLRRIILTFISILIFVFFSILFIYLYENKSPQYKKLSELEINEYIKVLSKKSYTPTEYILNKFKDYNIVIIGEPHRVSQHYILLKNLLRPLSKSGIKFVGLEFYEKTYQNKIDSFLKNKKFDSEKLREIILSDDNFFYYQELYDVFEEAWKINHEGLEINIIALESDKRKKQYKDYTMAAISDQIVNKGNKILLYTGEHHAFTKYEQPVTKIINYLFPEKSNTFRKNTGRFLKTEEFKRDPFHISLHYVSFKKYSIFIPFFYKKYLCLRFNGILDQILNTYNKPIGFDTNNYLIGEIYDNFSYYSITYSPLYLKDYSDGYIFLNPLEENKFVSPLKNICKSQKDIDNIKKFNPKKVKLFVDNYSAEELLKHEGLNSEKVKKALDYGNLLK